MNWIRQCLIRRRMSHELKQEIQEHLAEKIDTLMAKGMSRQEAEHQARRAFGNVTRIEERSREAWMWPMVESVAADARFAFRGLRKDAGFAITTCLTIALGIGATTAIFSLVHAVLLRPLPFPEQDKLMWLKQQDHSLPGVAPESLSYPDYFDWRAQTRTFSGMASYAGSGVTLESGGQAQRLDARIVSANFFQVLGVAPMLGRDFRWEDEKAGHRTVMLSYSLWQSAFGSAREIAGRTIRLGGHAYTVAGVMPKGFEFPLEKLAPALWLSLADDAEGPNPRTEQRGFDSLSVFGRLKPGATVGQARADLSQIASNLAHEYPDYKWYSSALIEPELQHMVGDTRLALQMLSGAVLLVLLIACANVAGLLLARGSRRRPEFALRTAIGASRVKIVRQLLVESVVISLCGGLTGVVLAYGLLRGMARLAPLDIPRMEHATVDGSVLLFAVGLSVVTGLLFGGLPAWRMSELEPVQALRDGTRNGRPGKHGLLNGLVIAQTAIGLVLLTGSGLLIRSFVRMLNVDPGFDPKHVLTARMMVNLPFAKLNHDGHVQFYTELLKRVSALPGVNAASAGWPLPMAGIDPEISFSVAGRPVAKADHPSEAIGVVMPGFFATMRIPLLAGRTIQEQDSSRGAPVMVINRAFADKYFPNENPIGKHVQVDLGDDVVERPMREVVGVVGNVKRKGLTADVDPEYYLPYAQAVITDPFITIRSSGGDPAGLEKPLQAALHEMDKSVPLYQVSTLEDYLSKSAAAPLFQTSLLTGFAAIALLLSAIGLYGLLSYLVVQRTPEIGLRLALGAQKADVLTMIVRRGLMLALAGLGAGLFVSAMMTRLMSGMLYRVRPSDPITFATVTAILLLVSLAATGLPAYRAACLDPLQTLREQ